MVSAASARPGTPSVALPIRAFDAMAPSMSALEARAASVGSLAPTLATEQPSSSVCSEESFAPVVGTSEPPAEPPAPVRGMSPAPVRGMSPAPVQHHLPTAVEMPRARSHAPPTTTRSSSVPISAKRAASLAAPQRTSLSGKTSVAMTSVSVAPARQNAAKKTRTPLGTRAVSSTNRPSTPTNAATAAANSKAACKAALKNFRAPSAKEAGEASPTRLSYTRSEHVVYGPTSAQNGAAIVAAAMPPPPPRQRHTVPMVAQSAPPAASAHQPVGASVAAAAAGGAAAAAAAGGASDADGKIQKLITTCSYWASVLHAAQGVEAGA